MTTKSNHSRSALVAAICLVTVLGSATWVLTDQGVNDPAAEFPVQAALPRDFLLHLSVDGVAGHKGCEELALAQMMEEPQMKAFLEPAYAMIEGLLEQEVTPMLADMGLTLEDVESLAGGGLTLTLVDFKIPDGNGPPEFDAVITIDTGKNPDLVGKIQKIVGGLVESQMGVTPETVDISGVTATRVNLEGIDVFWTGVGRHIVMGSKSRTLGEVATRLKTSTGVGGMLENEEAVRAWKNTAPDGEAVVWGYVDVDRAISLADASPLGEEPEFGLVLSMLGLDSFKSIAYGMTFEKRAIVDRMWVGTQPEMHGIYAGMKPTNAPLKSLAMAPKDCWMYQGTRFDLNAAFKEVRRGIAELDEDVAAEMDGALAEIDGMIGFSIVDDLLPSVGPEMGGWVASAPFGGMIPEMMFGLELRDAQRFEACLSKARASHGEVVRNFQFMGREIGYVDLGQMMNEPGEPGFGLKPAWMVQDGFVMFALAPQTLKNYIAAGNQQRPTLATHDDFAEARAHFGGKPGLGSMSTSFLNTGELLAMGIDTMLPVIQSVHMPPQVPMDMTQLPTTDVFRRHLFGITAMSSAVEGGYVTEIYSPTGYVGTLGLVGALAGAGSQIFMAREMEASAAEWEDWPEEEEEAPEPVEDGK